MNSGPGRDVIEVIWQGKYDAQGQRQAFAPGKSAKPEVIASFVGERASTQATLIHADALAAGQALLDRWRGKVDLIYLDPPFNSNRDHAVQLDLPGGERVSIPGYGDRWGTGDASFAHFLWQLISLAHALLSPTGSLWLHGYADDVALRRALMDDVFGEQRFRNQIVWHYTGGGRSRSQFSNKHDVLLWYSKSDSFAFYPDAIRQPYAPTSGYAKGGIRAKSGKHYQPHPKGTVPDDVWDIPIINPMARERLGYPTQKPARLLKRIVQACTQPGDLAADLCCGSGTLLRVACDEGRAVVGVDATGSAIAFSAAGIGAQSANFDLLQADAPLHEVDVSLKAGQILDVDWPAEALAQRTGQQATSIPPSDLLCGYWLVSAGRVQASHWRKRPSDLLPACDAQALVNADALMLMDWSGRIWRARR